MTYCLGIQVDAGLVFASDTRTNAGVDYVSTYGKMHEFGIPGQRQFVLLTAGNLATTQAVVNRIKRDWADKKADGPGLYSANFMFEAASYVGDINYEVQSHHKKAAAEGAVNLQANFILGGQIEGEPPGLFQIYPLGNHIAASADTPFLQIGESKYGKPILDRMIEPRVSLEDAARCALVSLDSTARSNVSVSAPFDLLIYQTGGFQVAVRRRYGTDTAYYVALKKSWAAGLREAFGKLPKFEWE